ncbi:FHA domain-containing protein [Streptomyces sp. NPDC051014]|uniref:FHA domain-containing protein n=1 Tax=Streptomyces sp. NPDC051014 TaxID=3155751 RepID=UPI0033C99191
MATVTTRYRCPVTPDECPSSDRRGFCAVHQWERLVPERVYVTAEPDDAPRTGAQDGSGPRPGTDADGAADVWPEAPADRPRDRPARPTARTDPREPREGTPAPPARQPAPAAPCLALVLAGALVPVRAEGQGPTRLGRDAADCAHVTDLAALDQLSRRHAELTWRAGRLYVTDLGSVNGTYVDERPVTRPVQLWPGGHRLRLADDVDVPLVELDEYGAPR